MNKIKKFIWIPIAAIAAVAVVIVVLCVVNVNPVMNNFGGYERIELLGAPDILGQDGESITRTTVESGLKDSGFSYMHAMLEGKYSYGLKLKTVENSEGETENAMITAKEIEEFSAFSGEHIIKLFYKEGEVRTLKVGGEEIRYDTVLIRLYEGNGEVVDVECIPYLSASVGNDIPDDEPNEQGVTGSEYYKTNIVLVKMNTSRLMLNINEFKAEQGI